MGIRYKLMDVNTILDFWFIPLYVLITFVLLVVVSQTNPEVPERQPRCLCKGENK